MTQSGHRPIWSQVCGRSLNTDRRWRASRQRERDGEQAEIAFQTVLDIKVVHPDELCTHRELSEAEIISRDRSQRRDTAFEISQPRAVPGDLLIVKTRNANGKLR